MSHPDSFAFDYKPIPWGVKDSDSGTIVFYPGYDNTGNSMIYTMVSSEFGWSEHLAAAPVPH